MALTPLPAAVMALLVTVCAVVAAEPAAADPISVLGDGRISALTVDGRNVVREDAGRNGFAVLAFDGTRVKATPMIRVTATNGTWVLRGERDLPCCTVQVRSDGPRTILRLQRAEGFPLGRDTSFSLHLGSARPLRVTCAGSGVILDTNPKAIEVTWAFPGQPGAMATYDDVAIEALP